MQSVQLLCKDYTMCIGRVWRHHSAEVLIELSDTKMVLLKAACSLALMIHLGYMAIWPLL